MKYETGAEVGPDRRYRVREVPPKLALRANAGSYLHLADDGHCGQRLVTLRTVRYTNLERVAGDDGYRAGRARLSRIAELMNRVEVVAFPDLLDRFEDRDIAEPFSDPKLASGEPVLVLQHLFGTELEGLCASGYFLKNRDGDKVFLRVPRVARMLRRLTLLAQGILAGDVAHVDLSPRHVLLLKSDEIPRILGVGHLVALVDGRVAEGDPALRFTSIGFAAPELISADHDWGRGASGEAVMLYGIGATLLGILAGGTKPIVDRCHVEGPAGALSLARELRDAFAREESPFAASRARLADTAITLLTQDPDDRLAAFTLESLADALETLSGDRPGDSFRDLQCAGCKATFHGEPERQSFDYANASFTLCHDCLRAARVKITRTAPRCGCTYEERAGDEWARARVGHQPRQVCRACKATRGGLL